MSVPVLRRLVDQEVLTCRCRMASPMQAVVLVQTTWRGWSQARGFRTSVLIPDRAARALQALLFRWLWQSRYCPRLVRIATEAWRDDVLVRECVVEWAEEVVVAEYEAQQRAAVKKRFDELVTSGMRYDYDDQSNQYAVVRWCGGAVVRWCNVTVLVT
jgi:hypothetical protein